MRTRLIFLFCLSIFHPIIWRSGGQASTGQGGFYGSGGARAKEGAPPHHKEALASKSDITNLSTIMAEVETLELELRALPPGVSTRTIEIKARIKKTISNPVVNSMLNRLEIKGEPVWGLSSKERDLVRAAKIKYMAS